MSTYELEPGDPDVGEVLRDFFLDLLRNPSAMAAYHSRDGRQGVIDQGLSTETQAGRTALGLLSSGSLGQIEEHIRAARYSLDGGTLMSIVWPPMQQPVDDS